MQQGKSNENEENDKSLLLNNPSSNPDNQYDCSRNNLLANPFDINNLSHDEDAMNRHKKLEEYKNANLIAD